MESSDLIYLDYQATTPIDDVVLTDIVETARRSFANPHSTDHALGWRAAEEVAAASQRIIHALKASDHAVVFTSGATESNNLALLGAWPHLERSGRTEVLVSRFEHACVRASAAELERRGAEVRQIPVTSAGDVDPKSVERLCSERTGLCTLMAVNNEVGTILPVQDAAAIAHRHGAIFHTDASQAIGRIPVNLDQWNADLCSISGHKCYGPKGVGALIVRKSLVQCLSATVFGGEQQLKLRPGTVPVELCVGLARAVEIAVERQATEWSAAKEHTALFLDTLARAFGELPIINGTRENRVPHNLNLRFAGIAAESLLDAMTRTCVSRGSACSSEGNKPSVSLTAMGLTPQEIEESFRVGFGRMTSHAEVEAAALDIASAARLVRGF